MVPKSHVNGILRNDSIKLNTEDQYICEIKKGGVFIMKPLTLHSSDKTKNNKRRRVIHLEFNYNQLTEPLEWHEFETI